MRVHLLEDAGGDGARVARVGVEGLDHLLNGDGGLSDTPGVVVGGGADEGVAGVSTAERREASARAKVGESRDAILC